MEGDLIDALEVYYDDPVAFLEDMLDMECDDWQAEVAADISEHPKVAVKSGQGVGKTALEAGLIIWFIVCRPYSKVVATAPTMQQLYDILWAEIDKWLRSSMVSNLLTWTKTKVYMNGDSERWFATAKTATKTENMQGFHEDHMLFVVDEASGVADCIMEAILGTLTGEDNKLLLMGNPNRIDGVFYDAFNKDRDKFKTHTVSSRDSKRTSRDNIAMLESKYGKDSDVCRVRIDGQFPKGALDSFISLETVELACSKDNRIRQADIDAAKTLHIGVDVARFGDDKTVITPRVSARVFEFRKFSKKDTMETVGNVIACCKEYMRRFPGVKKCMIKVDDSGVGGGVTDRLKEVIRGEKLPYMVIPVNNGSAATDEYYFNLGAQMWGHIKELLESNFSNKMQGKNDVQIELPNDEEMVKQLSVRKYHMTSKGKIQLESKDEMKKRGLGSPDTADSLSLALYEPATWLY
ncbi:AAA family ATPase [Parablautia intestinalis]|uniref:AAA family ATPase n=1 Tax=Parablautia intestinalis TaxID=2320100 RepID=UPI00256F3DA2|nr:AAA family ATPase [Parablautia intestinalis]